jgi:hypothetical protein
MQAVNNSSPTFNWAAAFAALVLLATLPARAAAPTETVGALLLRVQEESAAPFIGYCGTKVPDLKRSLQSEYSRFTKRFRKATGPLRAQIGTSAELSRPATPELIKQFEGMASQSFAQAQQMEPRAFCSGLKDNMSQATPESMLKNMQSAFAQYAAAARQGR